VTPLRAPLPDGPLDLIGDVHGEIDALRALLDRLGVDVARGRAERPLVFVGDLVDRGPDSVAVVELYAQLAAAGLAFAVLGNHELNVLMGERKTGNRWFFGEADTFKLGEERHPFPSRPATSTERAAVRATLAGLPLVLERPDLRVVHAMWDPEAAAVLPPAHDWAVYAAQREREIDARLEAAGWIARAEAEAAQYAGLRDPAVRPEGFLPASAEVDVVRQGHNPIKLLTSGAERALDGLPSFYTGGRWRFVDRVRWWAERRVDRPTVVGHYWRLRDDAHRHHDADTRAEPWDDVHPFAWHNDVFCVDYSAGRRYEERVVRADPLAGGAPFHGRLAALRWPERTLVFDDGVTVATL
jgi:hypothetical protein